MATFFTGAGFVKTNSAYADLQAWRATQNISMQSDLNLADSLSSSLGDALISRVQGGVNLASQAAAKRLGIALPGSSSSSSSATSSGNKASSVTQQRVSSVVASKYGSDYASKNITGTLATLDAIVSGTPTTTSPTLSKQAASAYGSNLAAQNITGFLANLSRLSMPIIKA